MKEINEKVKETLMKITFLSNEKDKLSFSFNSALNVKGKFAILEVSYNYFPSAQKYFERNFLQKEDKVISWYDDQDRSTTLRSVSVVLLDLGTKAIPPKHLNSGIYASKQEALCQELAQEMKTFRNSHEQMEKFWKKEDPPALEALRSSAEMYLRVENERLAAENLKLNFIRETPKQERVNDIVAMVCEIQFIQQYCSICHSTGHSLGEC